MRALARFRDRDMGVLTVILTAVDLSLIGVAPVQTSPGILSDQSKVRADIAHYTQVRGADSGLNTRTQTGDQLWELLGVDQWIG